MKIFVRMLLLSGLGLGLAGCGHLDLSAPASPERVLTGTVTNAAVGELPPGTEVTVRIVDGARGFGRSEVLGEQTIVNPPRMPVPFRIEYRAEDAVLRGRVTAEARVAVAGQLRYLTIAAHPITPGNVADAHVLEVASASSR